MRVGQLLEDKGANVVKIRTGSSLREAAQLLVRHGIGALIVTDGGGRMAGILSERDVARFFSQNETGTDAPVDAVMTADVISCSPDHSVAELAAIMSTSNIRHLPVVEGTNVVGMVSIRDVVRFRLGELEEENTTLRGLIAALE